jgi:hypothetical protein
MPPPQGSHAKKWVRVMKIGDQVAHFISGRKGYIRYITDDKTYMVVWFGVDEAVRQGFGKPEEFRRCAVFVPAANICTSLGPMS